MGAALYLMNLTYFAKNSTESKDGQFWSLGVEEQFYSIFPFILKNKFSIFLIALLLLIFVLPLVMLLQYSGGMYPHTILSIICNYLIKFQGISVGCLFSVAMFKYPFRLSQTVKITNIVAIFLIFVIHYEGYITEISVFSNLFISLLAGYIYCY